MRASVAPIIRLSGGHLALASLRLRTMSNPLRSYASAVSGNGTGKTGEASTGDSKKAPNQGQHSESPIQDRSQSNTKERKAANSKSPKRSGSASPRRSIPDRGRRASPNNSGKYSASEYTRRPEHIPNTKSTTKSSPSPNNDTEQHYVLTLLLDDSLHNYMTTLRKKYFPSEINRLDAHVSLFHALPGSKLDQITQDIRDLCTNESPFAIRTEQPYTPRGSNILVKASSPGFAIEGVQKTLREKWQPWLSTQDSGGFRPHWTIMNKVQDRDEVERALEELQGEFDTKTGSVTGLVLWRYERGWWKDRKVFEFEGGNV